MNVDEIPEEYAVAVLVLLGHVFTVLACWFFYKRMKRCHPSARISYYLADIFALTFSIAAAMGLIFRMELPRVDQVGFLLIIVPSQVAGAICSQIWMRAYAGEKLKGTTSLIGTFLGSLAGILVFPVLGAPFFFINILLLLALFVTFPFGLILVISVGLAYKLRTQVPLLPRSRPPRVEASHSHPNSPQDPDTPPKN